MVVVVGWKGCCGGLEGLLWWEKSGGSGNCKSGTGRVEVNNEG